MNSFTFVSNSWWKPEWKIKVHNTNVGSLGVKKAVSYNHAEVDYEGKKWKMSYKGWDMSKIFLHDSSGAEVGKVVTLGIWGNKARIELSGKTYTLTTANWLWTFFEVADEDNARVLELTLNWWGVSATIETPHSLSKEIILLASLVFYRNKLIEIQMGSVAVVSGGAVAASS